VLEQAGSSNVFALAGGFDAWAWGEAGYPIEAKPEAEAPVHP
jgi:hypothetical protein